MVSSDAFYMAIYKHPLLFVYARYPRADPIDKFKRSGSLGEDIHDASAQSPLIIEIKPHTKTRIYAQK